MRAMFFVRCDEFTDPVTYAMVWAQGPVSAAVLFLKDRADGANLGEWIEVTGTPGSIYDRHTEAVVLEWTTRERFGIHLDPASSRWVLDDANTGAQP